ncbi:MAG: histidine phosphatase family protein [Myxococcales bacterium]|nr:histidine phosphatase family protein [Myxococcales bacterium]
MDLFIMRHGPAEDASHTGLDSDRALTPKGRERVRLVARELIRLGEVPTLLLTSPLVRARETAEIVVQELSLAPYVEDKSLGMTGRAGALAEDLIKKRVSGRMLVGHEPELSSLVAALTGHRVHMEKAMVVAVRIDGGRGRHALRFVLEPKTLHQKTFS